MDTRQLQFFIAAAEERNFTRAAERSYVSQPGLSQSIQALERELRTQLFERTRGRVRLTRAGAALLPRARRITADVALAQAELQSNHEADSVVRVGAEQCLGDLVDLADLFGSYIETTPSTALTFAHGATEQLIDDAAADHFDLVLVALDPSHPAPDMTPPVLLRREPFVLLVGTSHPLASRIKIDWREVRDQTFVDLSPGWAARDVLDATCQRLQIERCTLLTVGDVYILLDVVDAGRTAAILPESMVAKHHENLVRIPFAHAEPEWMVWMLMGTNASPLARLFASMLLPAEEVQKARNALTSTPPHPS